MNAILSRRSAAFLSELAGTGILMLIGLSGILLFGTPASPLPKIDSDLLRLFVIGLCFGSAVMLVAYSPLGRISGAHLKPALTLAMMLDGRLHLRDGLAYIAAQCLGALLGVALFAAAAGPLALDIELGMTRPAAHLSLWAACLLEALCTFVLVWMIFLFLERPALTRWTGLAAGLLIAVIVMFEAPLTGTSINPARSLAPALLMNQFDALWIYLISPPIGAVLAALLWQGTHHKPKPVCSGCSSCVCEAD